MKHFYENIHGWFSYEAFYKSVIEEVPDVAHIVEVGVWKGRSAAYLAVEAINSKKKIRIDLVDHWLGSEEHLEYPEIIHNSLFREFERNISPVKNYVNIVRMSSLDATNLYKDESLDMVFLDASHDYDSVKNDLLAWYPKIKKNGWLAGHDYDPAGGMFPGVKRAVDEVIGKDKVTADSSCWRYRKLSTKKVTIATPANENKITAIMSTYNEINFLPLKIQWCRSNNMDLYVCDNMSTDGTWELLQKEGIPSHQYDTDGIFSEKLMQEEIRNTLLKLNPKWVLYMGCDMFFDIPENYAEYDYVSFFYYAPKYTGEVRKKPFNPFINYRYATANNGALNFLFRWSEAVVFDADHIIVPGKGLYENTLALNYGDTKTPEEREETKARKQKAWDKGEYVAWGSHYLSGSSIGWLWERDNLVDLSLTSHWDTIQRIAKEAGL